MLTNDPVPASPPVAHEDSITNIRGQETVPTIPRSMLMLKKDLRSTKYGTMNPPKRESKERGGVCLLES